MDGIKLPIQRAFLKPQNIIKTRQATSELIKEIELKADKVKFPTNEIKLKTN
jgi:hypothetical protein